MVVIFTVALNRLTERYLLDTALPASVEAIRNDIERMLGQPLVAAADIAGNTLLRDWLAAGEDPAERAPFIEYLEAARARNKAFTTMFAATDSGHYYNEKGLDRTLSRDNPRTAGSTATSTAVPSAWSTSTSTAPPASWRCSSITAWKKTASWWAWRAWACA